VFAKNILCELYGICLEDEIIRGFEDEMMNTEGQKSIKAEDSYGLTVLRSYGLEIYPNPGKDYISVVSEVENCLFELIDATGKIQKSIKLDIGNNTINISSLQQGFYIYKVVVRDRIVTGKWIKK